MRKELLLSAEVSAHYDPNKLILLQCDASNYGLDAFLSHIMEDGTECPVGFASTLQKEIIRSSTRREP